MGQDPASPKEGAKGLPTRPGDEGDRPSHVRELSRRSEDVPPPVPPEAWPEGDEADTLHGGTPFDPHIAFVGPGDPSAAELLSVESYLKLPRGKTWPDLDDPSVDEAPATIREPMRVPSDALDFDERIKRYLDRARAAFEPELGETESPDDE